MHVVPSLDQQACKMADDGYD